MNRSYASAGTANVTPRNLGDSGRRSSRRRPRPYLHALRMSDYRIGIAIWDGAEERECAGPYEVLTAWANQAQDRTITVETVADGLDPVTCAHGLRVIPDTTWADAGAF